MRVCDKCNANDKPKEYGGDGADIDLHQMLLEVGDDYSDLRQGEGSEVARAYCEICKDCSKKLSKKLLELVKGKKVVTS